MFLSGAASPWGLCHLDPKTPRMNPKWILMTDPWHPGPFCVSGGTVQRPRRLALFSLLPSPYPCHFLKRVAKPLVAKPLSQTKFVHAKLNGCRAVGMGGLLMCMRPRCGSDISERACLCGCDRSETTEAFQALRSDYTIQSAKCLVWKRRGTLTSTHVWQDARDRTRHHEHVHHD
jgi:hypothetical protein